jgi:hypothetical protein
MIILSCLRCSEHGWREEERYILQKWRPGRWGGAGRLMDKFVIARFEILVKGGVQVRDEGGGAGRNVDNIMSIT